MLRINRKTNRIETWKKRLHEPVLARCLAMYKSNARGLGFSPQWGVEEFQVAVIVIAAASLIGPFPKRLVSFTGYPPSLVARAARNMRKAGLWRGDEIDDAAWFNDDGSTRPAEVVSHILVALGIQLARKRNGRWEYRPSDSFLKKTAGLSRGGLRVPRDADSSH